MESSSTARNLMSWGRWEIWRAAYLACLAAVMCVAAGWLCWRTWQDAAALAAARAPATASAVQETARRTAHRTVLWRVPPAMRYALDGGAAAPGRAMAGRGDVPPACTSACDVE